MRVNSHGGQISFHDPDNESENDQWMHMTTVRMLEPWEKVLSDFSISQSLSNILEQFPSGTEKRLNSLSIENVIKAAQLFSNPTHSVRADDPFVGKCVVRKVTVDVDSVSATFNNRTRNKKLTIENIFTILEDWAQKDTAFCENTTSFMPNGKTLKAFPSNGFRDKTSNRRIKCCGPTIEIHPDGGYSRIQLPTPIGAEVLKIWIYAPDTSFKSISFVDQVRDVANECAKGLVAKYKSSIESTLKSAIDENIKGFKAFDIPGGYMFPISIALLFLEKHQECSFLVETYNCKKKGLEFFMEPKDIGTERWLKELTAKIKLFLSIHPNTMLKMFCRLDRLAQVQENRSKIGFGFQIQYEDPSGNTLYSLCQPDAALCNRVTVYPMAFLPSELASRLSFLKSGVRIQSYIPLWNEANFKRNKKDRSQKSNLGLKHCMDKDPSGALLLNVTQVLRGAKDEQTMIDNICGRFTTDYCERVEIAVPWILGHAQSDGPLCYNHDTKPAKNRWLDLRTMLTNSFGYIKRDTRFWHIGPIAEYTSLNFAAALAVYQISARGMADTTLLPLERDQLCQNMVYLNYLLRIAKDGKLWQNKFEEKLSVLTRGAQCGREMMLPPVPSRVYSLLAAVGGVSLAQCPTMSPVAANQIIENSSTISLIEERVLQNSTVSNNFGTRVLRCRSCDLGFYGGKGINDVALYRTHLKQFPSHALHPGADLTLAKSAKKMTNKQWSSDYNALQETLTQRYTSMYNDAQKRGYDAIMNRKKSVVLLGVAGAGKSLLVLDLLPLLRCVFWKKDEVHVCGATNVVAQRTDNKASTFHSFLGIVCYEDDHGRPQWNFSVQQYLKKIEEKKEILKKVRVVVIEEGVEVPSDLMEAYFSYIHLNSLKIVTIVNGDCCQGAYREDEQTHQKETSFFAHAIKLAQWCPTLELIAFTTDQRTKCEALKQFKKAVRNAVADDNAASFVSSNQYVESVTKVDIVLCSRIKDMDQHNSTCLQRNQNAPTTFIAVTSGFCNYTLNYKAHGVNHSLTLKCGAPVMFMQHYKTTCGKVLQNGTLGTVLQTTENSVHVEITPNKGLTNSFEVKRVQIGKTQWHQLPLHLSYAGTIAKCIGFEFETIAINFGIRDAGDCVATWRQKQAYTAISRAKQKCYFIGQAPIALLNNMDMQALAFFNRLQSSNQKQAESTDVVRNVFEMREFWVRRLVSRYNKRAVREEDDQMPGADAIQIANPIIGTNVLNSMSITVYANTYPSCEQNLAQQGHILAAESHDNKLLLLKRYSKTLGQIGVETKRTNEIHILTTCKDIPGVLKLVATVDQGIVLERMASRVPWKRFVKESDITAKQMFCDNLHRTLCALREKKIRHGHISSKTAWVDAKGQVKLTWFEDAYCDSSNDDMYQDIADAEALCKSLVAEDSDLTNIDDHHLRMRDDLVGTSTASPASNSSIPCKIPYACKANEFTHSTLIQKAGCCAMNKAHHEDALSEKRCSSKCVQFSGNLQASEKAISAITWLLEACVEIHLISPELLKKHHEKDVIAYWEDRDVKHRTEEREKTGGGITDVNFWTELMANLPKSKDLLPASIHQVFTDFGSEFCLQGFLCALHGDFEEIVGIEFNSYTFQKSVELANCLMLRAQREQKFISKLELHYGNFLNHDAIIAITMRSTIVHANNVVFGSNTNVALVDMWRKHLPAGATIVIFDETAILSSEGKRMSRSQGETTWASKQRTISTSVSWQPYRKHDVHLWQVSKEYTELRDWATRAEFIDLLGWAILNDKAQLFEGDKRSDNWMKNLVVLTNSSTLENILTDQILQLEAHCIVLVTNGIDEKYKARCDQFSNKLLLGQSSRANLDTLFVLDNSEPQHPVVEKLMHMIGT